MYSLVFNVLSLVLLILLKSNCRSAVHLNSDKMFVFKLFVTEINKIYVSVTKKISICCAESQGHRIKMSLKVPSSQIFVIKKLSYWLYSGIYWFTKNSFKRIFFFIIYFFIYIFVWVFLPMKLCLYEFSGKRLHCFITLRGIAL